MPCPPVAELLPPLPCRSLFACAPLSVSISRNASRSVACLLGFGVSRVRGCRVVGSWLARAIPKSRISARLAEAAAAAAQQQR
eukprot:2259794-Alexandrium_andersonii.AAC.1